MSTRTAAPPDGAERDGDWRPSGLLPAWFALTAFVALGANILASGITATTVELMRGMDPFARQVRAFDLELLPYFTAVTYIIAPVIMAAYLWPLVAYSRCAAHEAPSATVQRRVISGPLAVAAIGFATWLSGLLFFPAATLLHFGHWSPELMSQHILSPLVNGFLAATTTYLCVDWIFRRMLVPRVFPRGGLAEISGAAALGVRGRMLVFLTAVAFVPMFTLLGLVRSATVRLDAGFPVAGVRDALARSSEITFLVYVLLGIALTLLQALTFTRPLQAMATALRRIGGGDLDTSLAVTSSDELGVLEDGVNTMVETLRERDRILATFGRVVEPAVRDQLLAGNLPLHGELRTASILFCDLRGFTALAETAPPAEVVSTLNEFFTAMTAWVRQSGGVVDKFIGDAMLVVFGLFSPGAAAHDAPQAAASAVRCALGMRHRLRELNTRRAAAGRPPLAMKIGVHTGEVVAGTIGARDRHEYTVIGDAVNVAFRLQQLAKEHGQDVLISETTYNLAAGAGMAPGIEMSDSLALRGRHERVRVYGVAG